MRNRSVVVLLLFSGLPLFPAGLHAQKQDETAGDNQRKVINRVVPQYPDLARRMHLNGVVKIEAEVASNGTVKDVSLKGGHPVLAQAALNAVRKWRWAPAAHETAERIEVKFDPDN